MGQFSAPGLATGLTIAGTTFSYLSFGIVDVTLPAQKVKSIDVSTMGTVGGMVYLFGKLIDNGELKFTCHNKIDLYPINWMGVSDTWVVTFPLSGSGTVHASATFTGAITDYQPKSTGVDAPFEADVTIKVSGNITTVAQS